MLEEKIKIKYICDGEENPSVVSALNHLKKAKNELQINKFRSLEIQPNEIIVLQISSLDSGIFSSLVNIEDKKNNNIIFVFTEKDALLLSSIIKLGFKNFFVFPKEYYKFLSFIKEILENKSGKSENELIAQKSDYSFQDIIGITKSIKNIIELTKKIADKHQINILILGETGTGKGLLAKAIHNYSSYKNFPFIDVVCTAIPENLMESELFGYEKGAFTNAQNIKPGLFEIAEKGTLFLDEIGDLNISIQSKLLRTIDKKIIRRLGGVNDIPIEARIISATNKNLELLIEKDLFREDLYHRLNVVSIELPPLRKRRDDIVLLANYYIDEFNKMFNKSVSGMDYDFKEFILNYSWPGNVRELQNIIERGMLLCDDILKLSEITNIKNKSDELISKSNNIYKIPDTLKIKVNYNNTNLRELSKLYAKEVLRKAEGNKSKASKMMGISRPKLDLLLK